MPAIPRIAPLARMMVSAAGRRRRQRAPRGRSAACGLLACILPVLVSCGRMFDPPLQARFAVEGCAPVLPAFDPGRMAWETPPRPVIERGAPGEWDAVDALNPSVVRFRGRYLNLYSGFDGKTWRTGTASSADGTHWQKHGPVLSPEGWEGSYIAANGAAAVAGGGLLYWYQAGPRQAVHIALAYSDDGFRWRKRPAPVLRPGPRGSWDETAVADPYALACGEWFYLFYLGQNRHGRQRLGLARSRDGVHWQKEHRNPLLAGGGPGAFDERGVGEPAVFRAGDTFYMLYAGRSRGEHRQIGWAESPDGVNWKKMENAPRLAGGAEWSRAVVCDPEILVEEGRLKVLFGAGDKPSPDENLNGAIGAAALIPQ